MRVKYLEFLSFWIILKHLPSGWFVAGYDHRRGAGGGFAPSGVTYVGHRRGGNLLDVGVDALRQVNVEGIP